MISVCIATYNGEKYIKKQLISILSQLSDNDEVIISDDGSSDNTLHIIKELNDDRIKIYHNKKKITDSISKSHIYTSSNFENAIKRATGNYIFLSDQDDIWVENKVNLMLERLKEKEVIMAVSNFSVIDENDNIIEKYYFDKQPFKDNIIYNLVKMPFYGCCMAFKKELLKKILPFPNNLILHDNWIAFLAKNEGKVAYIEEPLILYRRHGNNVSSETGKSSNPLWYKVCYRISFYQQYIRRVLTK